MWFHNLRIYRLSSNWKDSRQLNDLLAKRPLAHCGSLSMLSRGWVFPKHDDFVHSVNGQWLIALGVEEKLLPATVIRQETKERIAVIETEQGREVGRKEQRDLRDHVLLELMPRAFTRLRTTWAWIDPTKDLLVIDAGSDSKAEEFLEVLIPSLGDIQISPLQTQLSPTSAMTEWLAAGDAPVGFTIDDELELRNAASSESAIRYVKHPLENKEIRQHIANGKIATRLGLTWNDSISFILADKFQVKRLAFLDKLKDADEQSGQDADEQFDADFTLMAGQLNLMIPDLVVALGGEM
ncbi:MAG: recombination-associated protein RdgC [Georgfuchsia sp.]